MSTYAIPNRQVNTKRKTHKKKYRLTKDGKFIVMVAITFAILFLFSMFIYALSANSVNVDAGQAPIYSSGGTSNNGTFNDVPAILVSDSKEETEAMTDEIIEETTEEITDDTTPPDDETQPENSVTYSDDDLYYLAAAVCREAGGEPEEIQLLVANVIINRVNSDLYPNTIYGVLTQRNQYGTMWRDGVSFPSWATDEVKEQCYSVARRILEGERFCPENVIFQAEFQQGSGIYKYFEEGYYFCYYG